MYKEHGSTQSAAPGPFPNPLMYGAGSDILRTGIGAYGEKLFGTGRQYVESNVSVSLSLYIILGHKVTQIQLLLCVYSE